MKLTKIGFFSDVIYESFRQLTLAEIVNHE